MFLHTSFVRPNPVYRDCRDRKDSHLHVANYIDYDVAAVNDVASLVRGKPTSLRLDLGLFFSAGERQIGQTTT